MPHNYPAGINKYFERLRIAGMWAEIKPRTTKNSKDMANNSAPI
jgi:hypothetical protein